MGKPNLIPSLDEFRDLLVKCDLCNDCLPVCPTYRKMEDKRFSPIRPVLLGTEALRKGFEFTEEHLDNLAVCALCGRCIVECPPEIDIVSLNLALKKAALKSKLDSPGAFQLLLDNLKRTTNLYGIDNQDRIDVGQSDMVLDEDADYLLYLGCMNAFDPDLAQSYVEKIREQASDATGLVHAGSTTPEEARACYRLMKIAGLKVATLRDKEICCGWPARAAGDEKLFKKLLKKLGKALKKTKITNVVTTCAMCYHVLKEYLPRVKSKLKLNVVHAAQLLDELIQAGKIPLHPTTSNAIYHEGCYLGRYGKVYEAPRRVIQAVTANHLLEMESQREKAACCGGSINFMYPDFALWVGNDLLAEAQDQDVKTVVNVCPLCEMNLNYSAKVAGDPVDVVGLCKFVYDHTRQEKQSKVDAKPG